MLRGRRVGKLEAVGSIVHAYVPDKGLVQVAEEGQGRGLLAHGFGAMAQFSGVNALALEHGEGMEGAFLREKGGFAAVGIAEEEDRDCGWTVHEQLPVGLWSF